MRIDILTTFPEMFSPEPPAALGLSIPSRARDAGLVDWHAHNLRDWTNDKRSKTDDRPFGGGPGMVMMCQPIWDAFGAVEALDKRPVRRVYMTPQGRPLTQPLVEELSKEERLVILAGHYEGVDERVIEKLQPLEISVGDYVLSGGELGAMVLIDAVVRLLPGALGDGASAHQDSFGTTPTTDPTGDPINPKIAKELGISPDARLLDCPHYTRPRVWEAVEVPQVLLSGDHGAVARWRLEQMLERTRERRPDLLCEGPGPRA